MTELPQRMLAALAKHHRRSPDPLSDEQVQACLLHLLQERQLARSSVNVAACAARFLYCEVLGQSERWPQIPLGRREQRLPELLTRAEVAALLGAAPGPKARTLLMTAYASGLRVSELCALRGRDIESAQDRMCIRVVQGKGRRDRLSLLTPDLLEALRLSWRTCRRGAGRDDWLFASASDPTQPLDSRSAQRYLLPGPGCRRHRQEGRHPHPDALLCDPSAGGRRGPAQHHADLHSISQWLGHNHLNTTARYLRMATPGYSAGADALSLLSQLRTPPSPGSVARRKQPATSKATASSTVG